jgi:hypothetical protein
VLLVLLIIFMITLPLSRRDFDVQVPPEQKQQPRQKQQSSDQIVLELKPDGSYAINTQPVPFEQLDAARAVYGTSRDGRTQPGVLLGPELSMLYLGFDVRSRPLADPRVRRALSLAIDRPRLAALFGGAGALLLYMLFARALGVSELSDLAATVMGRFGGGRHRT